MGYAVTGLSGRSGSAPQVELSVLLSFPNCSASRLDPGKELVGMRRIKDLTDWPPQPGGFSARGDSHPYAADQVVIKKVEGISGNIVEFSCLFGEREERYHFHAPDRKTAEQIVTVLNDNLGKLLLSIADAPIPED
jgi:hypothetical protein